MSTVINGGTSVSMNRISSEAHYEQNKPLSHTAHHVLSVTMKVTAIAAGAIAVAVAAALTFGGAATIPAAFLMYEFGVSSPVAMVAKSVITAAISAGIHQVVKRSEAKLKERSIANMGPFTMQKTTAGEVEQILANSKTGVQAKVDALKSEDLSSDIQGYLFNLSQYYEGKGDLKAAQDAYSNLTKKLDVKEALVGVLSDHKSELGEMDISTEDWNLDALAKSLADHEVQRPQIPQPPLEGNLVKNSLFLSNTEGWSVKRGTGSVVKDPDLFGGRNVLHLNGKSEIYQTFNLPKGKQYFVTAYVKGDATVSIDGKLQTKKSDKASSNTEWSPVQFRVFADGGDVSLKLKTSKSDGYFSQIEFSEIPVGEDKDIPANPSRVPYNQVVPLPNLAETKAKRNLLANTNFDEIQLAMDKPHFPWSIGSDEKVARLVDGGDSRAIVLDTVTKPGSNARVSQHIPFALPPGQTFNITGKVWIDGEASPSVKIEYTKRERGQIDKKHQELSIKGELPKETGKWQDFSLSFDSPEEYAEVSLKLESLKYGKGMATFKDLKVEPASEAVYNQLFVPTEDPKGPKRTTSLVTDFSKGDILEPKDWLLPKKSWAIASMNPNQVTYTNEGVTLTSSGESHRTDGGIVTRDYFGSSDMEATVTFPKGGLPEGYTFGMWSFSWASEAPATKVKWEETNPERNTELDTEIGSIEKSGPPHNWVRANTYGGQYGGERDKSNRVDIYNTMLAKGIDIYDGNPHKFTMRTVSGAPGQAGYVEWFCDGHSYTKIEGEDYGQDDIPRRPTRFWIGIETPKWGGKLDKSSSASVTINSVKVTPLDPNQFPIKNDKPFAMETGPNGRQDGDFSYAWPGEYPKPQSSAPTEPMELLPGLFEGQQQNLA